MEPTTLVRTQRAFFQTGATRSLEFRRTQLRQLRASVEDHAALLYGALHADLRKSAQAAYATEIGLVVGEIDHALRHLRGWMKPRRRRPPLLAWPARGCVQSEPYGLALILGPWNYPVQLLLSPLVGAMAAGNCAILKPSELAPRTAAALRQTIGAAFPDEYLAVIEGDREVAEALLREKFDTIFFTGSTRVGRAVMRAAAQQLTPVTLELGGKCPCLVCADAPPVTTARRIAWGKFMNAGQTCVAPDFVLVDRRRRDELIQALKEAIRAFYGDDPRTSPHYGRIINRQHFDRLRGYLAEGSIAHGGEHDAGDLYLAPTILTGVPRDAPAMQEEVFGPILPVVEYDDLEGALARLRHQPTPLALYLFSRDRAIQDRVLAAVRSGGVCINDTVTHMIGAELPFGGLGESGLGAYHGRAGFEAFSHLRSVLRRSLTFDPGLRYPPSRVSLDTLKRAYRFLLRPGL